MKPYHTHDLRNPMGYSLGCNLFASLHKNLRYKMMINLIAVRDRKALVIFKDDLFNRTRRDLIRGPITALESL